MTSVYDVYLTSFSFPCNGRRQSGLSSREFHLHLCASKMHLKQLPDVARLLMSPRQIQLRHCQPFNFQPYKALQVWSFLGICGATRDCPKAICIRETQIAGLGRTTSQDSVFPTSAVVGSCLKTNHVTVVGSCPSCTPCYTAIRNEAHSHSLPESVWTHSFEIVATQAGLPLAWQSFCCLAVQ